MTTESDGGVPDGSMTPPPILAGITRLDGTKSSFGKNRAESKQLHSDDLFADRDKHEIAISREELAMGLSYKNETREPIRRSSGDAFVNTRRGSERLMVERLKSQVY
jgi:hypothetical protein